MSFTHASCSVQGRLQARGLQIQAAETLDAISRIDKNEDSGGLDPEIANAFDIPKEFAASIRAPERFNGRFA